jgi:dihydroorotate dehydrogenase (fumarate)
MIDMSVNYMGLRLKNPLVASASPLSRTLTGIRELEDAGIGAIVLYSLFEEQIARDDLPRNARPPSDVATALGYFPRWENEAVGPQEYLDLIALAKRSVTVPIIGSLNGVSPGQWTRYARLIQNSGADALEINLYYLPEDPVLSSAEIEDMYVDVVRAVKAEISLPLAVKIVPFFTSVPHIAQRLVQAGADALVLFNRFYHPDLDIETREGVPQLTLSNSDDLRLPLHGIALLYRAQLKTSLALTSGVHSHVDALKALMVGADVVMMASELLQNGIDRVTEIRDAMSEWMEAHGFDSVAALRGIANQPIAEPAAWARAKYVHTLRTRDPHAGHPFV